MTNYTINRKGTVIATVIVGFDCDGRPLNFVRNRSNRCDKSLDRCVPHLNKYNQSQDKLSCELIIRCQINSTRIFRAYTHSRLIVNYFITYLYRSIMYIMACYYKYNMTIYNVMFNMTYMII